MIIFDGIYPAVGGNSILVFKNENDDKIEIPIRKDFGITISMYLEKIKTTPTKTVEHLNEEE